MNLNAKAVIWPNSSRLARDRYCGHLRTMKKPTLDERRRMCTGKRRYRTQGDALDGALLAGVERRRKAYLCALCGNWHLTSV